MRRLLLTRINSPLLYFLPSPLLSPLSAPPLSLMFLFRYLSVKYPEGIRNSRGLTESVLICRISRPAYLCESQIARSGTEINGIVPLVVES